MRTGDWIQTYSGRQFWPLDPRADEIFIEDIAHALSLQCRYAGHCKRFYSVAEHSVHLCNLVSPENALWALLHDASEAYLVDVPRPLKRHLRDYKDAEIKVMAAVCERFGLSAEMPEQVHEFDDRIIGDELTNMVEMSWHAKHNNPIGAKLHHWSPDIAELYFLGAFRKLTGCAS